MQVQLSWLRQTSVQLRGPDRAGQEVPFTAEQRGINGGMRSMGVDGPPSAGCWKIAARSSVETVGFSVAWAGTARARSATATRSAKYFIPFFMRCSPMRVEESRGHIRPWRKELRLLSYSGMCVDGRPASPDRAGGIRARER